MSQHGPKAGRWGVLGILVVCLLLLGDQFVGHHEEQSIYLEQDAFVERESRLGGRRHRSVQPPHRWGAWRAGTSSYTARLANGRLFQLGEHDNGVLRHGDSVRVVVASLSGRVLYYQPLSNGAYHTRASGDLYEDLSPFPILLSILCIWFFAAPNGSDTQNYLRLLIHIIGLVFSLSLFAVTYPLFKALGWIPRLS